MGSLDWKIYVFSVLLYIVKFPSISVISFCIPEFCMRVLFSITSWTEYLVKLLNFASLMGEKWYFSVILIYLLWVKLNIFSCLGSLKFFWSIDCSCHLSTFLEDFCHFFLISFYVRDISPLSVILVTDFAPFCHLSFVFVLW